VHGTVLLCAEDAHHRLRHKRILENALGPGGRAEGYSVVCVGHSLGAGVACVLALQLKATLHEAKDVRYLGFEPPGGLLCRRLSRETQRLGWIAVVCSHDWVPRIGIKNLQKLKVLAMKELHSVSRSKWQLAFLLLGGIIKQVQFLCCFRRPIAMLFDCLGGGKLHSPRDLQIKKGSEASDVESLLPSAKSDLSSEISFSDLWPPGDIAYFRPLEHTTRCCGIFEQDTEWAAEWADPEDLNELVLSTRAVDLHVPWVYEDAIENVASAFVEEARVDQAAASAKERSSGVLGLALCSRSKRA